MSATSGNPVKTASGWAIALGVLMIILGVIAICAPFLTAVYAALVLGWAVVIGGVVQIVHAFQDRQEGHFWVRLLVGILYVVAGWWLLSSPMATVLSLTLLVGAVLVAAGILDFVRAARLRPAPGSGWLVFDGIISLLLGILIWAHWPWTAAWVIGTFIGVALIFRGMAVMAIGSAARQLVKPA